MDTSKIILIAHRGNLRGPVPERENSPAYLQEALDAGYHVEVDVWYVCQPWDSTLRPMTGHEKPEHEISIDFLRNSRVWIHCKNDLAWHELSKYQDINCFMQDDEPCVRTNRGWDWYHSTQEDKMFGPGILVKLDFDPTYVFSSSKRYPLGICTDYPSSYAEMSGCFQRGPNNPFDLLVIDIDGVLTDGTKIYDRDGRVSGKTYCDLDFTAIKRFKAAGVKVCFLSGDTTVNKAMADSRKIDFFHARLPDGRLDKSEFIPIICNNYNIHRSRTVFVGDDYYDLSMMYHIKSFCPRTSPAIVKRAATVLDADAGKGVIAALYDLCEDSMEFAYPVDSPDLNPK